MIQAVCRAWRPTDAAPDTRPACRRTAETRRALGSAASAGCCDASKGTMRPPVTRWIYALDAAGRRQHGSSKRRSSRCASIARSSRRFGRATRRRAWPGRSTSRGRSSPACARTHIGAGQHRGRDYGASSRGCSAYAFATKLCGDALRGANVRLAMRCAPSARTENSYRLDVACSENCADRRVSCNRERQPPPGGRRAD